MRRALGWIGLLLIALIGAGFIFGLLYLFAPHAPTLLLLVAVPLLAGAGVAAALARLLASRAGVRKGTASGLAAILAALPLAGLLAAVVLSPELPREAPGVDPRGPHHMLKTPAGSAIAWWSFSPTTMRHQTPVVFLAGGPGTFVRNRDFDVAQGFRDAGFRTIFYDQAGSGASGNLPVQDYTVARAVADLEALRAASGAEKIVVWGQSWGASLAAAYVRANPDRVAATILDSPGDFPGEPLPLDYSKTDTDGGFKPTLRDATLFLLISRAPQLAERWQSQDDARATQQARVSRTEFIYGYQCKGATTRLKRPLSPAGGNLYPQLRLQGSLEQQPKVATPLSVAPALLIRGSCDYLPLGTAARYMKAFPAAERLDVPGRGHAFYGYDDDLRAILNRYASTKLNAVP